LEKLRKWLTFFRQESFPGNQRNYNTNKMTKDKSKNKSKEKEEEPSREDIAKKTLEDSVHQQFVGSNYLLKYPFKFGELGQASAQSEYAKVMTSDTAKKIRDELYKKEMENWKNSGLYEKPNYPADYAVAQRFNQSVQESSMCLKLGDLEGIISKMAGDGALTDKLPDQLKNFTYESIAQKVMEAKQKGENYKPSETEQEALQMYNVLMEAYTRTTAKKLIGNSYLDDVNAAVHQIAEKYESKEKK
jgi:hypothetical protein